MLCVRNLVFGDPCITHWYSSGTSGPESSRFIILLANSNVGSMGATGAMVPMPKNQQEPGPCAMCGNINIDISPALKSKLSQNDNTSKFGTDFEKEGSVKSVKIIV